jgi:hypothetical protein
MRLIAAKPKAATKLWQNRSDLGTDWRIAGFSGADVQR